MNKLIQKLLHLFQQLKKYYTTVDFELSSICCFKDAQATSKIIIASQNVHFEDSGAYTGEIS